MAYKFEIKGYYFKVTDTGTGDILINETRETLKWTINEDGEYQFIQKGAVPQSIDEVSPTLLRIGRSFAFVDIVDSGGSAFSSESVLQDFLSAYVGYICCSDVEIELNGTSIGTVPGGTILELDLEDTTGATVTPNSSTLSGSQLTLVFPVSSPAPVGATLMKTGQTTSYASNDDGGLEAGRATDFFTLSTNNPFGNTNRFTDELGGSTYANNIVIDWSTYDTVAGTVLGYYRTLLSSAIWSTQVSNAASVSIGTYTTGWRLVNYKEFLNIFKGEGAPNINYAPFNIIIGNYAWTSTSRDASVAVGILTNPFGGFTATVLGKANSYVGMACRTFTVSGTTLT